jgi:hypothetical protein
MQDSFGPADSLKRAGDTVEARIISSGDNAGSSQGRVIRCRSTIGWPQYDTAAGGIGKRGCPGGSRSHVEILEY